MKNYPVKINLKYFGIILIVVTFSCLIHEFGHYIAGVLLGNKMTMTLNMASPVNGFSESWHAPIVYSAGPLITLMQAILAFFLITYYTKNIIVFAFLLEPVTLRIWPYLVSPFNYQDEARIADHFGISPWIIPVVIWLILGLLAFMGSRKMKISPKFVIVTILLILVAFQIVLRLNNLVVGLI